MYTSAFSDPQPSTLHTFLSPAPPTSSTSSYSTPTPELSHLSTTNAASPPKTPLPATSSTPTPSSSSPTTSDPEPTGSNTTPRYVVDRVNTPPRIFKAGLAKQWQCKPVNPAADYTTELTQFHQDIVPMLEEERKKQKYGIKVHVTAKAQFDVVKEGKLVDQPSFHFPVKSVTLLRDQNIYDKIAPIFTTLDKRIQDRKDRGSGFRFGKLLHMDVVTCLYQPNKGGFYIPSPRWLSSKNASINIKSKDEKCLLDCIIAHLHPVRKDPQRPPKGIRGDQKQSSKRNCEDPK